MKLINTFHKTHFKNLFGYADYNVLLKQVSPSVIQIIAIEIHDEVQNSVDPIVEGVNADLLSNFNKKS